MAETVGRITPLTAGSTGALTESPQEIEGFPLAISTCQQGPDAREIKANQKK